MSCFMGPTYFEKILPIRTVSEANCSDPWIIKAKRHAKQKRLVYLLVPSIPLKDQKATVKLTRLSPRQMDLDNMMMSLKWITDGICERLVPGLAPGRADGDKRITLLYDQQPSKSYGVKVEITITSTLDSKSQ